MNRRDAATLRSALVEVERISDEEGHVYALGWLKGRIEALAGPTPKSAAR